MDLVSRMETPQGRLSDPRPDLAEDSRFWVYLLRWAWLDENEVALGVLDGIRCCGARLEWRGEALRIVPGAAYLGDWEGKKGDKEKWLAPHKDAITKWLRLIAAGEMGVLNRADDAQKVAA